MEDKIMHSLNKYLLRFLGCENRREHLNILSDLLYTIVFPSFVSCSAFTFFQGKKNPSPMFKFLVK